MSKWLVTVLTLGAVIVALGCSTPTDYDITVEVLPGDGGLNTSSDDLIMDAFDLPDPPPLRRSLRRP